MATDIPTSSQRTASWIANIGLLLVLAGTALPLFSHTLFLTTRWIFSAGALLCVAGRAMERFSPSVTRSLRVRRLKRIEMWSAIMFAVAAVFMFLRNVGPTDWIAFTLAGGALTCYTSIMIPRVND